MLKKRLMLGLIPLAVLAVSTSVSANPSCPDLSNSGLSDEEIIARCSDKPERFFAGIYTWFSHKVEVTYYFFATHLD